MADKPDTPTTTDLEAGADVVAAGEKAAAAEPDPDKRKDAAAGAIQEEAHAKGWKLDEEQAQMLAGMVVAQLRDELDKVPDATADRIAERGGYDKLPEPLTHPPATGAGELPPEPPATAAGEKTGEPGHDTAPGAGQAAGMSGFARWFRGSK